VKHPVKYIVWRGGRPRFVPGLHLRRRGFRGENLIHPNGEWFTAEEAEHYSARLQQEIRRGRGKALAEVLRQEKPDISYPPQPRQRRSQRSSSGRVGYVYFLKCGTVMKIGFSSNPFQRLRALNTGLANEIDFCITRIGTMKDEKKLHARLLKHRFKGEWFFYNSEVEEVMMVYFYELLYPQK